MNQLTTDDYIRQLQDATADEDVRRNAAWRLGRLRDITVVEPLLAALADPSAEVRVRVAEALGGQRDQRVPPALIQALAVEPDLDTQIQIIRTLGQQEAPEAVPTLESLLAQDEPAEIRSAAAAALSELHHFASPQTIALLVDGFIQTSDETVRYQMSQALQRIGGSQVVQALVRVLSAQLDVDTQVQLIEQLGLLGDASAGDALAAFVDSDNEGVRETAQWALSRLQS
jgi:HEAT repeat protein